MGEKVKGLKSGILVFTLITIGSLCLIYLFNPVAQEYNNFKHIWKSFKNMNIWYLGLSLVITLISLYLSAYRRQLLANGVDKKLKFAPAMHVVLGYEFLSAITPFGSGGQPLEVWILKKNGFSWGKGIVITYMNTASMILVLFLFGPLALFFYPDLMHGHTVPMFMIYGMVFLLYFAILTFLSIFKPRFAIKVTNSILKFARKIRLIKEHKFYGILKHSLKEIKTFNIHIKEYFSGRILLFLYILFVTLITYAIKWAAAFTICLSLGIYVDPLKLIFAQMFILFANYSIPTPGAAGTSEILALSIFAILTPNFEVVTMTFWRFFTFYLIFLIALVPSIRALQMKEKEKHLHAEDIIRPNSNNLKNKKA